MSEETGAPIEGLPFDGEKEEGGSGGAAFAASPDSRGSEAERASSDAAEADESPVEAPQEEVQAESSESPQPSFDFPDFRPHYAALRAEAAALGLDFEAALSDPRFVRLTAPGMGVSAAAAWHALHAEDERAAWSEVLAGAVSAGRERPREGGGSGAALLQADPRQLSPDQRAHLKQRIFDAAARGEKIYPSSI